MSDQHKSFFWRATHTSSVAPAIAHFLVGAGLLLIVVAPIAYRYDLDHTLTPALVPIGGIWGIAPDIHHVAPIYQDQLRAIHSSPWMDLFALHYLLDTPTVRGMYHESVFGSILFFSVAVVAYSAALRAQSTQLHPPSTTIIATGYGGFILSVLAIHQHRYHHLAAVVGTDSLVVGWLVLAGGTLLAGTTIAIIHEVLTIDRLFPVLNRRNPAILTLTSVPLAGALWLGVSVAVPAWFRAIHNTSLAIPWLDWMAFLWLLIFAIVFSTVYALFRVDHLEQFPAETSDSSKR